MPESENIEYLARERCKEYFSLYKQVKSVERFKNNLINRISANAWSGGGFGVIAAGGLAYFLGEAIVKGENTLLPALIAGATGLMSGLLFYECRGDKKKLKETEANLEKLKSSADYYDLERMLKWIFFVFLLNQNLYIVIPP